MSNIAWTDVTWNPAVGCSMVSTGCTHCYAEIMAVRLRAAGVWAYHNVVDDRGKWTGNLNVIYNRLDEPFHWKKPRMVFVNSMSDLFHEKLTDAFIERIWSTMEACQQHTFQILTKREHRMYEWYLKAGRKPSHPNPWPLPNVWQGVSVESRMRYRERVPCLSQIPARVRFISFEPLLEDIGDLMLGGIFKEVFHWAIIGGESGKNYRPMELLWMENIIKQCQAAGVKVFVKQDAALRPGQQGRIPNELWIREYPI